MQLTHKMSHFFLTVVLLHLVSVLCYQITMWEMGPVLEVGCDLRQMCERLRPEHHIRPKLEPN